MRKPRILQEGATYHVTSEINRGKRSLKMRKFKKLLLRFIEKIKKDQPFELFNFCIMNNHIHFLIKPAQGQSLSRIMQSIKCNFAKEWNKEHRLKGHLWGERFFSRIIKDEGDFLRVCKYIDENPVKANMVKEAKEWEFGGLFHHRAGIVGICDALEKKVLEWFPLHRIVPASG